MRWSSAPLLVATFGLTARCDRQSHAPRPDTSEGGTAGAVASESAAPSRPDLTLLYTSDLRGRVGPDGPGHSGGLARRATLVDRVRLEGGTVVQVDAGDLLAGPAEGPKPGAVYGDEGRTRIVFASYGRMGVDVVAPGERDLALGLDRLKAAFKAAKVSVVAANLVGRGDEHPFPADTLITAGDRPIGVFGILDLTGERAGELQRRGFHLGDATEAARASVQSLRAHGAQLVVGLFHVDGGVARVKAILGQLNGASVDVVILGHGGDGVPPEGAATVGRTRIVWAGAEGTAIGRLDLRGLATRATPPQVDGQVLPIAPSLPEHPGVALIERVEVERVRAEADRAAAALRHKKGQPEPLVLESWTYGSNAACGACHVDQLAQWSTTDHAQALATLQRKNHGHDPGCLGCHTVGYLQPGGTRSFETLFQWFPNVGCESCHGPSADHVRSVNKKLGTSRKVGPAVCLGCHTSDQNIGTFDYATALKSILGPGHGASALKPSPL